MFAGILSRGSGGTLGKEMKTVAKTGSNLDDCALISAHLAHVYSSFCEPSKTFDEEPCEEFELFSALDGGTGPA